MKGKFVVVEGIEGGGKTSAIEMAINTSKESLIYSSGFPINSRWDRFVHSHPDSTLYYLYFAMKSPEIKSRLSQGQTIIQDKYIQAVDSFLPDCRLARNRVARAIMNNLFIKPDIYIYFDLSTEESLRRISLKTGEEHKDYYKFLLGNPQIIEARRKEYDKVFNNMKSSKVRIDVTNRTVEESAQLILEEIAKC